MRRSALNVTAWHLGCDKTTFSHITLSLSLCLSLSSASCSVFFTLRTCVCVCAVNVSSFVWLFWLCLCVLVCCRHCSPVHCFFSVFTAHHWASLSVCLPNLHPKFRLFIYKQLVRYCTVFSTYAPSPALPCLNSTPTPWNMLVFVHWHWDLGGVGWWMMCADMSEVLCWDISRFVTLRMGFFMGTEFGWKLKVPKESCFTEIS